MAEKKNKKEPFEDINNNKEKEDDVINEFNDSPQFPFLKRIPHDEIIAELQARYEAEKPARDALQAKREKAADELISLGMSEESAKFLTNLE